ncbi:response regulator transcription factor [Paenibacillus eucommiae]|uniref:DNA-binding NarL/FixJ family response regulator n=1 Tax=Paenibacillus eucommiae TaxID=1355755 RepID=A0ABS4IZT1_9BACL|nr:response regulator transcription factor [Paenibacillus eucommiae]MBP1993066.1 DNA-binding NarL/FixJ family response regulator [Paenibacillus eucommiae]
MSKTTILIADDQPLIRDGLAAILNMEENYTVVAKTGDGLATIKQVQLHRPQLVLMDIHMPKLDGLNATKQIKTEFPDTKVLILTTFEDEEYILEAIRHGASGFLVKGVETEQILSTIQDCLDGRINYPFSIQSRLIQALQSSEQHEKGSSTDTIAPSYSDTDQQYDEKLNRLSIQERNIVKILKQGKSNQAIASELFLTTGTVKNYLSTIYKKLNVSSRSETVAYLHENDL